MKPIFFQSPSEFRKWLEKNHKIETEIVVGFHKVATGKPSMTWSQSVDEALCFGWIDGIRRSIDKEGYCIRFTPRKLTSNWSTININKVEELIKQGLMQPAGLEIYKKRKEDKSRLASYENAVRKLDEELEKKFKENKTAWEFFIKQAPSYQRTIIHWIISAKQEITRFNRLNKTITESENQRRIF